MKINNDSCPGKTPMPWGIRAQLPFNRQFLIASENNRPSSPEEVSQTTVFYRRPFPSGQQTAGVRAFSTPRDDQRHDRCQPSAPRQRTSPFLPQPYMARGNERPAWKMITGQQESINRPGPFEKTDKRLYRSPGTAGPGLR